MAHDDVHDRATFLLYLEQLRAELSDPMGARASENVDLPSFLEAMQAWVGDWPEPFSPNPWRHLADVVTAATLYE